jgi:4-aminobutyrate aminotransferase
LPEVQAALRDQLDAIIHSSTLYLIRPMVELAELLVELSPAGIDCAFFVGSGTEAVEAALLVATNYRRSNQVISFRQSYHGRSFGAVGVTGQRGYSPTSFSPLNVQYAPYANCLRCPFHLSYPSCEVACAHDLRTVIESQTSGDVAAVIVEPIQGVNGFVTPPPEFLPIIREICDEYGILLIADEVQSGFGRTGRMFAVDHTGVEPDIMCVAKALGNGMPIAATIAPHRVMRAWHEGEHGSTFGGNPVACAAAIAVIQTLTRERIPERAERLGRTVMERARGWQADMPALADVRGLGLMIGLEFMQGGAPATALVDRIAAAALARGLLVLSCGIDGNVIRLIPPLTIPEIELDAGLDILEAAMREVAR